MSRFASKVCNCFAITSVYSVRCTILGASWHVIDGFCWGEVKCQEPLCKNILKQMQSVKSHLTGLNGQCLRWILRIWSEKSVINVGIAQRAVIYINDKVRKKRWKWLKHIFTMQKRRHPCVALTSNLQDRGLKTQRNLEKNDTKLDGI